MVWYSIFTNSTFYLILGIVALAFYGIIRSIPYSKKIPIVNNKKTLILVCVVGFLLTSGFLGSLGVGSIVSSGVSGVEVSQLQTTTPYVVDNSTGGVDVADSGTDNTRMSDFYIDEVTANENFYIEDGVFLVTRSGSLGASSCQVSVSKPARYDISDTTYHIVDEDSSTGRMYAYVYTGSSSSSADSNDPRETNMLAFDEGVATGYVSFKINLDETGFDPLTQYDYKDVNVDICGYPYTFRIHKSDA